jgi:hypothetical protein
MSTPHASEFGNAGMGTQAELFVNYKKSMAPPGCSSTETNAELLSKLTKPEFDRQVVVKTLDALRNSPFVEPSVKKNRKFYGFISLKFCFV